MARRQRSRSLIFGPCLFIEKRFTALRFVFQFRITLAGPFPGCARAAPCVQRRRRSQRSSLRSPGVAGRAEGEGGVSGQACAGRRPGMAVGAGRGRGALRAGGKSGTPPWARCEGLQASGAFAGRGS